MTGKPRRLREPEQDRLGREAFINLFLTSNRFTEDVEQLCREEDLAMSHFTVLWFLVRRHEPEGVPMSQVADGLLNRASDATRLADRLTKLGHLERFGSATDRRVVLVRVTEQGRRVFLRLSQKIKALHRQQWQHLAPKELSQLNRLLAKAMWGADADGVVRHPLAGDTGKR